jgi:hypothetical protein
MITFPLIALVVTALFLAAIPVVFFALALETCERRAPKPGPVKFEEAPVTLRVVRAAA